MQEPVLSDQRRKTLLLITLPAKADPVESRYINIDHESFVQQHVGDKTELAAKQTLQKD